MKRVLEAMVLACMLVSAALAAGCGSVDNKANPYGSLQTPGPPPPARSGSHVLAVGMPLLVVASADGGATWQTSHRAPPGDPFRQVLYGVAFGDAPTVGPSARPR